MTTNSIPGSCSFPLDQKLKQTQTSQTNDPFLTGKTSSFHGNKDRTREGKNNRQRGIEWPKMSQVKWKVKWEIIVSVVLFLCTRRKQMEARQDAGWPKLGVGVACVTTRFKKEYQLCCVRSAVPSKSLTGDQTYWYSIWPAIVAPKFLSDNVQKCLKSIYKQQMLLTETKHLYSLWIIQGFIEHCPIHMSTYNTPPGGGD